MFRGRGGPTDRRLPKHNARRTRHPRQGQQHREDRGILEEEVPDLTIPSEEEISHMGQDDVLESEMEETTPMQEEEPDTLQNIQCYEEMEHLRKRVKNLRESIQFSEGIASPKTYEQNVLNVAAKCVNEWRSIVTHYPELDLDEKVAKGTSLAVFELIQHSLQCGPLAGAKPGYFKRCGGQVAKLVVDYMDKILPHESLGQRMGFTAKQLNAMEKWNSNALKAAENDKPPSSSIAKKQQKKKKKK